jgi:hypothetical protein
VGLLLISVVIHGHMVLKVCVSNCKLNFAKGAYYDMKNPCCPMTSNYCYHKIFEKKIRGYRYNKKQKFGPENQRLIQWHFYHRHSHY